jgi:hypothetical protein
MLEPAPAAGLEGPRARHEEAGRGGGVEKEVWDALEWDGVDAGHHPSLYATPVHARCYKKRGLLRGTVLRYVYILAAGCWLHISIVLPSY